MIDPEAEAAQLLEDDGDVQGARALVRRHLGDDAVLVVRGMAGRDAELVRLRGRPVICVRPKLTPAALR